MLRLLTALLLLACSTLPAQAIEIQNAWAPVVMPRAEMVDVRAQTNGHVYRIFVSQPTQPAPEGGYPVLYVLDANAAFPTAAFMARNAESRREITRQPPLLVVGIGYPGDKDYDGAARTRDYTVALDKRSGTYRDGGADIFLEFIEKELKPFIEAKFPVNKQRQALFGHSYGGLFALNTLLTRPSSFSTFLISSPSIWWSNRLVLSRLNGLDQVSELPQVQITVGSLESESAPGRSARSREILAARAMIPEARKLAAHLGRLPGGQERVQFYELEGEDHGRVWMPAMARGVTYFLDNPWGKE